jgi:Ran GTPase-activating protein (RanGAP) involved in mRNA processing and transport
VHSAGSPRSQLQWIGSGGAESLAGGLGQCSALAHLSLRGNVSNNIRAAGAERLAGVLGQCAALTHLDLRYNVIYNKGALILAGVLPQCAALTRLDFRDNGISAVGGGRLRGSWRGQASGLVW